MSKRQASNLDVGPTRETRSEGTALSGLKLVVVREGLVGTHVLPASGESYIGRAPDAPIRLDHDSVSRKHAALRLGPPRVEDLGSLNGTFVNQRKLSPGEQVPIKAGDVLRIGDIDLLLQAASAPATPKGKGEVVESPVMKQLHQLITQLAASELSVLLLGETGVGKDVVARALHERSPRAKQPFVSLNCAAVTETLLESELFGHEKGSFSGADRAKEGLLEAAQGGTVFLDEVGELPLSLQAKLLRVIEDKQVLRVGSVKPRQIDVRFVSATNRDLATEATVGRFRQDLYFRLNGMTVWIPPLRERTDEIAPLARHFLKRGSLAPAALQKLAGHRWPGNVRELKNVIERAQMLAGGGPVEAMHIVLDAPQPAAASAGPLQAELSAIERDRIVQALEQCAGNQTRAAELLGMPRRTLVAKLAQLGVPRPRAGKK
jgi:two-component system, NtrC family, response regulator AtoC